MTSKDILDDLVNSMRRNHIPLTRENYLDLMYAGEVPKIIPPETEAEMPDFAKLQTNT